MKLSLSVLFYLVAALLIAAGIVAAVKGHFWLLGAATITYMILLIKEGCLTKH